MILHLRHGVGARRGQVEHREVRRQRHGPASRRRLIERLLEVRLGALLGLVAQARDQGADARRSRLRLGRVVGVGEAEAQTLTEDREVERGGVGLGVVGTRQRRVGPGGRRDQQDGGEQSGDSGGKARSRAVHSASLRMQATTDVAP